MNSLKRSKGEIKQHLDKYGVPAIQNLKVIKPHDAVFNEAANWLQAFTTFETDEARGKGFLRLRETSAGSGDYRAFTFFTTLWEIKGHEEFAGHRRPLGAEHGTHDSSENWLDRRHKQIRFEDADPAVLIVGGGQNGYASTSMYTVVGHAADCTRLRRLMLAARLGAIGVKTLVVEKNGRVGDSWRKRYHTLCLHDPIWCASFPALLREALSIVELTSAPPSPSRADHFAYMQFPKTWPICASRRCPSPSPPLPLYLY